MKTHTIELTDGKHVTVSELPQEAIASGPTEQAGDDFVSLAVAAYKMPVDRTGSARPEGSLTNCAWYWNLLCSESRPHQDTRIAWIEDGDNKTIAGVLITESTDQTKRCPDGVIERNADSHEIQFGEEQKAIRAAMCRVEDSLSEQMPRRCKRLDYATEVNLAAIAPEYDQTSLFQDLVGLLPSEADYVVHVPVTERGKWEACGFNALGTKPQEARTGEKTEGATIYEENGIPDQLIMVSFSVDPTEK